MEKPTYDEIIDDYNHYIFELKNGKRAILTQGIFGTKLTEVYEARNSARGCDVCEFTQAEYNSCCTEFEIVKVYLAPNDRDYLYHILNSNSIIPWDWDYNEEVEEMTMEEVCKALGKTIKIVKEK